MSTDATVLVCRGCCCGSVDKHPEVDHDGQLRALVAAAAAASIRLRVTDCLGCCERSNVVVVRAGPERSWFGNLLTGGAVDEVVQWIAGGVPSPPTVAAAAHIFDPSGTPSIMAWPIDGGPLAAARLVRDLLAAGGTWSVGVPGAIADSGAIDGEAVLRLEGPIVLAVTPTGALRLRLNASTGLFAVGGPEAVVLLIVAVRRQSLATPASGLTSRGPDGDAIDRAGAGARLYDLGIGHPAVAFCVRTADPALGAALDEAVGTGWRELLESDLGRLIVNRSPVRVVETGAGRAEVASPIPAVGGESPAGAHTHLDPGLLELGGELPGGIVLPDGWVPAAFLQPPPGWALPR